MSPAQMYNEFCDPPHPDANTVRADRAPNASPVVSGQVDRDTLPSNNLTPT